MKLQIGKRGQPLIGIPTKIIEALGWEKGDELVWTIDEKGKLILKKEKKVRE